MNYERNWPMIAVLVVLIIVVGYMLFNSNDPRLAQVRNMTLGSAIAPVYYTTSNTSTSSGANHPYAVPLKSTDTAYSHYSSPGYYYQTQTYTMPAPSGAGQNCYVSYRDQYHTVTTCQQ